MKIGKKLLTLFALLTLGVATVGMSSCGFIYTGEGLETPPAEEPVEPEEPTEPEEPEEPTEPEEPEEPTGQIVSGAVYNAQGNAPIANAQIDVYSDVSLTQLIKSVLSNAAGTYELRLPAGTYYINITEEGFISFETTQVTNEDERTYVESFVMVEGEDGTTATGTIGGSIINAFNGNHVSGAQLLIREGWNNTTGAVIEEISTSTQGQYQVSLPLGNYTVSVSKDGYIANSFNIVVTQTENLSIQGTLNPDSQNELPSGDLRIVLTWGERPKDLDSHLVGPSANGNSVFHTYYSNKSYTVSGDKKADLDLDDTTSYGPETTTIYDINETGVYSFYVHDFTNKDSSSSTSMSMSGAKVQVYKGDELIATYHIPTNQGGTLWHVFDFNAETERITGVNALTFHSTPSSVGQN
ncbi:MAG: carboxypeptidase regulatory-like domain-containing protein [Clostridia bacterium]|nr:carboxypeptidase regulatory-like domain-containing protein [Clostridia bacterium]